MQDANNGQPPKFATLAVHAGAAPDPSTGARVTPIYQTTSFVFNDADHAAALFGLEAFGNIYTRIMNPTQAALEGRLAALEDGTAALAVASGHAAEFLVFHTLMEQGDEFVATRQLYGGSVNQFNHAYKKFGWNVRWADGMQPETIAAAITDKTRAIFCESMANPAGNVMDLEAIGKIAKDAGVPLIVDNTMASPYLCQPKAYGADIVVHSLTKFIGGQGNSIGGVIVDCGTFDWLNAKHTYKTLVEPNPSYNGMRLAETFGDFAFAIACRVMGLRDLGPSIAPMNAFLILNGVETLPLRMRQHCENALAVAQYLQSHEKVAWVNYAGLPDNPNHETAKRICPNGFGAVFTFGLKGGFDAGVAFVEGLEMFSHLANIGDTRSLVIHPASTTHRQLTDEERDAAGAGNDVVRLSVGIEDKADIIADLEQSLSKVPV